jgi:hypothetical protein
MTITDGMGYIAASLVLATFCRCFVRYTLATCGPLSRPDSAPCRPPLPSLSREPFLALTPRRRGPTPGEKLGRHPRGLGARVGWLSTSSATYEP